ncbi:MAG: hypothetical protein K0S61_4382, partial [Anaerocolumna sp.]|nr:hypothetical protein [Anaerocolumna sp.]
MSRLTLIYDFQSFNEDYQDKFEKYNRDYDDILANPFLLWTFPGSGEVEARYEKPDSLPTINETYRDE